MAEYIATHTPNLKGLDAFTRGYLTAVEFTEAVKIERAAGFSNAFLHDAINECAAFQSDYATALELYERATGRDMESAGQDFWLSRNRNGAGFWSREIVKDYPEKAAVQSVLDALTTVSHGYGVVEVYVDSGTNKIYGG
jgi:hypothetical protein